MNKNGICEKPPKLLLGVSLNSKKGDLDDSFCDILEDDIFNKNKE